jgi:hypothetical protein
MQQPENQKPRPKIVQPSVQTAVWHGEDESADNTEQMENTQERSDAIASEVRPNNKFRREQEHEAEVEENINTDPAALEESGELSGPPGPSVSHTEKGRP